MRVNPAKWRMQMPNNKDDDWFEKERLHFAAGEGDLARIKELIEQGYPVNTFDDSLSRTPLHYAAIEGHTAAVRYLIEAGADPAIPGWMGRTALDRSEKRKKPEGQQVRELLCAAAKRCNPRWPRLGCFL